MARCLNLLHHKINPTHLLSPLLDGRSLVGNRCARCQYTGDDLAGHADTAGHPLCVCCGRSLRDIEAGACGKCVGHVRADLADIIATYTLLPAELVHHASERIPGGDALVMLAAGSTGIAQERAYRAGRDYSHDEDEVEGEIGSVAFELARWEDDWRHVRGQAAVVVGSAVDRRDVRDLQKRTLLAAVTYLTRHLDWAAAHHPEFAAFTLDVRRLVAAVQMMTATAEWPVYGAHCQYCERMLVRAYDDPDPCRHGPRPDYERRVIHWQRLKSGRKQPVYEPAIDALTRWLDALALWETQHKRCRQGGLVDEWACPSCKRRYTDKEYRLALRRQAGASVGWMPVHLAADLAGLASEKTLRTWVERLQVSAYCGVRWEGDVAVRSGPLMVLWADVLVRIAMRRVA